MKLRQISAFAYQLTRMGLFNCYLVRESDSYTLIDTGLGGSAGAILAQARRTANATAIARILLTHAHMDHIGSLDVLAPALGRVDVAISQREARLLPKPPEQDRSLDPGEPQCPVKGGFPGAETAPTHFVEPGELFGSLRCIATPGHTPGHVSFFDERDGTLYAGDALLTVGGRVHVAGAAPWYFPLLNRATWHAPTALCSAHGLMEFPIQRIAAGHGRVVESGHEALRRALREADAG